MFSDIYKEIVSFIKTLLSTYLLWISLHHISVHLYSYYCAPLSFVGFLFSPFIAPMPHCVAMRWVIYNGGRMIEVMWIIFGKWMIDKLIINKLMPVTE